MPHGFENPIRTPQIPLVGETKFGNEDWFLGIEGIYIVDDVPNSGRMDVSKRRVVAVIELLLFGS